jgi:hypothetical protein
MPAVLNEQIKKGKKHNNKMKKTIILLMTVSIMLTSCGKAAGLSNSNKKADNNPLLAGTGENDQSQEKKDNDNVKQSWTDYVKNHQFATGVALGVALSVILVGSFFGVKWIIKKYSKQLSSENLQPLPKLSKSFEFKYDIEFFKNTIDLDYITNFDWNGFSVEDLIFIYRCNDLFNLWRPFISGQIKKRGYDVSRL